MWKVPRYYVVVVWVGSDAALVSGLSSSWWGRIPATASHHAWWGWRNSLRIIEVLVDIWIYQLDFKRSPDVHN